MTKSNDTFDSRKLIDEILRIWNSPLYQNKSRRINESTYTHDVLLHLINFLLMIVITNFNTIVFFSLKLLFTFIYCLCYYTLFQE